MHLIWSSLRWLAHQIGLTDGRLLDPAFNGRRAEVHRPIHLPEGRIRLHIFAADFASDEEADTFCFGTGDEDIPEPITQELDGAVIDTDWLEIVRGNLQARLLEFLSEEKTLSIINEGQGRNTLIILTEEAFSGLPFQVHDTETLRYLGAQIVAV